MSTQRGGFVKNTRIIVSHYGGPDQLQVVEEECPEPKDDEVRVKVLAAGVSLPDVMMREGIHPETPRVPFTPGWDLVGMVDRLGNGVSGIEPGQIVAALPVHGAYAEFVCLRQRELVPVPPELDPAEAVSLVLNYITAYQMLHRVAVLHSGQGLLVHSAAGGVGTAALQLGRLSGLRLFGTASKAKHEILFSLGATPIDYRNESFVARIRQLVPQGLDSVFDPIGGRHWWESYRCLRPGGSLVCYGAQAAVTEGKFAAGIGFALLGLMRMIPDRRRASWYNVKLLRDAHPEWFREDLTKLFELLAERQIQPLIASRLPLRDAPRANEMLEKAQVSGKIVLLPHS